MAKTEQYVHAFSSIKTVILTSAEHLARLVGGWAQEPLPAGSLRATAIGSPCPPNYESLGRVDSTAICEEYGRVTRA